MRHRSFVRLASLALLTVLPNVVIAQATAPASAPADASTPKGTVKLLQQAMESGDAAAIRKLIRTETPTQRQMTDAMIEFTSSYIALRKAAAGQFGEAATADVMGPPSADASLADSAKEVPAGPDRVRLEMENGPPVTLRKTDGQWQVVPEPPPGGDPEAQLTVATRQTKAQSDVFSALAAEVAAGRYKSMNEVKSILQNRMMAAAMTQAAAENQSPATAPATRPALAPEDMMP